MMAMIISGSTMIKAADIHVATNGSDDNPGTQDAPLLTIHRAMEMVSPGDRILVHEGTYVISERIKVPALKTTPDTRCELRAWPDDAVGKVIIDGSGMHHTTQNEFKMGRCIYVNHLANYWTFYGLVFCNAEDNGMKVEGSYNIIERCVFHDNNDTGLQIGMYKDFSIEETKTLPAGTPQFNPGYQFCRYNKVINCDSYNNRDLRSYNGTDDGGDADGFACKLFPGPGTEFHGCRAWTNSDDNWDLYMVYHPVVIDSCWAYHAGYLPDGSEGQNGNGFKLGGGGSSGGAAFHQSLGAHVITNCVSFVNLHKGFDQNNAYEGMYVINCTAWGNEFNYRFPTMFKYGGMTIRNCVGWGASGNKGMGNHEFLSAEKEGSVVPDTEYNSWTTLDGCNPYKEGQKTADGSKPVCKDYSSEFLSLSVADFMAPRETDGSLPKNDFARLKPNSVLKDKGIPIVGFTPRRHLPEKDAVQANLELITADDIYIGYNDAAPDFGAFELDGIPADIVIPEKIKLTCVTSNSSQEIMEGQPIENIVYEWNDAGTEVMVEGLAEGLVAESNDHQLIISGMPAKSCTFTVTVTGVEGVKPVTTTGIITIVRPFRVLTGDWYHFLDEEDNLPADLKDKLSLIQGDKSATSIDPEKDEAASGFGKGALCLGESNGGFTLALSEGVFELKINLFFTGGRQFKISYTMADGTSKSVTTEKYKKGSYGSYDLLETAGLSSEDDLVNVRSITFQQEGANGGARIYDMFIRVPDNSTCIDVGFLPSSRTSVKKYCSQGRIVIVKNGILYNIQGQTIQHLPTHNHY